MNEKELTKYVNSSNPIENEQKIKDRIDKIWRTGIKSKKLLD